MSGTPPPPPGFQVESNPLAAQDVAASLPPGFQPEPNPLGPQAASAKSPSPPLTFLNTLEGEGELALTGAANILPAAGNAIDYGLQRAGGRSPAAGTMLPAPFGYFKPGEAGENLVSSVAALPSHVYENGSPLTIGQLPGAAATDIGNEAHALGVTPTQLGMSPGLQENLEGDLKAAAGLAPIEGGVEGAKTLFAGDAAQVPEEAGLSAEENLARQTAASQGNMGAAAVTPSLQGTSPELQDAVAKAKNINHEALARQIDAETLPMPEGISPLRLRKGQATADAQQISDEKNLRGDPDTQGILSNSITEQNQKLGAAMGEIRRQATPGVVHRTNLEHGQTAIDAIKARDNQAVEDIRAKYKALADQNAGAMPIDKGTAAGSIDAALAKGFLTKTAAQNPVISEVMDGLRSEDPMSFESFENARTNLAAVQRAGGIDAAAAGIVRNGLEEMPLSADAASLKKMANDARAAAKARFDTIEQNPAYAAVANDNVPMDQNGLHVIGAPSPLADTFMDRYFLGNGQTASRSYIARMQSLMKTNPDFANAVEASALNKLRNSAGLDQFDNGEFRSAAYRNTRNSMDPKADVLMTPKSAELTDQLKRVAGYVNDEGKAATVNRSNTAITLQRFGAPRPKNFGVAGTLADYATDVGAAHAGPVGYALKRIGSGIAKNASDAKAIAAMKAAKLGFALDATAPGAGIEAGEMVAAPRTPPGRAAGGKVDHEVLLSRLMNNWHAARRASSKSTEPLLNFSDGTIARALEIAGRPPV